MKHNTKAVVTGILTGFINGLFGGGGGLLLVPLLKKWHGLPVKNSHATSIAITLVLSFVSAAIYINRGAVNIKDSLPFMAGGVIGGYIGGRFLKGCKNKWLEYGFAALLVYSGARMLLMR